MSYNVHNFNNGDVIEAQHANEMDAQIKQNEDDIALKANTADVAMKEDTVLTTTLSRGRKANTTVGEQSFAFGYDVEATGQLSVATGNSTVARGTASYAEGNITMASNNYAHAEGYNTVAAGVGSHAEGVGSLASGNYSHAENASCAYGIESHAEGTGTTNGRYAHAEGYSTTASDESDHAEGYNTEASGSGAHSEGHYTTASSTAAHAEGYYTTASGINAHSEGYYTTAKGASSHAEGYYTIAGAGKQHVSGSYNIEDGPSAYTAWSSGNSYNVGDKVRYISGGPIHFYICNTANDDTIFDSEKWDLVPSIDGGLYAEIVGIGESDNARANGRTLDWSGNEELAGDLTIFKGTANETSVSGKIDKPAVNGTEGQVLMLDENLVPEWETVTFDQEDVANAVSDWMNDHPEATTTVQDGSITYAKLDSEVQDLLDSIDDLSSDLSQKQDAPEVAGTVGQVLGLDAELNPTWLDQDNGGGGTFDYSQLNNKPSINNVTLAGNKTLSDLGAAFAVDLAKLTTATIPSDLDLAVTTGLYYTYNTSSNRPANYCMVYVFASSDTTLVQFALSVVSSQIFTRQYSNGTWKDWCEYAKLGDMPLTYGAGTYTDFTLWGVTGYITTSGTSVQLFCPLNVAYDLTNISITSLIANMRNTDGGYLGGSDANLTSYITEQSIVRRQNMLRIQLTNNSGWGITNNTPLVGIVRLNFTLS